jgi:hypothetical protein
MLTYFCKRLRKKKLLLPVKDGGIVCTNGGVKCRLCVMNLFAFTLAVYMYLLMNDCDVSSTGKFSSCQDSHAGTVPDDLCI